jgi:hypothetical protein
MTTNFINHTLSRLIKLAALPGGGSNLPELGNFSFANFNPPSELYKGQTPLQYATDKLKGYGLINAERTFPTLLTGIHRSLSPVQRLSIPQNLHELPRFLHAGWELFVTMHELDYLYNPQIEYHRLRGRITEEMYQRMYRHIQPDVRNIEPVLRSMLLGRYWDYARYLDLQGVKLKILEDARFTAAQGLPFSLVVAHPEHGFVRAVWQPNSKRITFEGLSPRDLHEITRVFYSEIEDRAHRTNSTVSYLDKLISETRKTTADWVDVVSLQPGKGRGIRDTLMRLEEYNNDLRESGKALSEAVKAVSAIEGYLRDNIKNIPRGAEAKLSQGLYQAVSAVEQLSDRVRKVAGYVGVDLFNLNDRIYGGWHEHGVMPRSLITETARSTSELFRGNLLMQIEKSSGVFEHLRDYQIPIVRESSLQYVSSSQKLKFSHLYSEIPSRPVEVFKVGSNPNAWRFLRAASRLARR